MKLMPETGDPYWLVLLYAGGYNDLQPEIAAAVGELCSAPLPAKVELAVLASFAPAWMVSLLRPGYRPPASLFDSGAHRLVTDPRSRSLVPDPRWRHLEYPLREPESLYSFLDWGLRLAPGARVALILAGHAAGILGAMADYSGARTMLMTIPALAAAVRRSQDAAGRRIDLLLLDTCYLNTVEVLYELAGPGTPCGKLLILPGDDAPLAGMPYRRIIDVLGELSSTVELEEAATGVASAVNRCWGRPGQGCFALRLSFEPLEQLRVELDRLAADCLSRASTVRPLSPPIGQMRGILANTLVRLAVPGAEQRNIHQPAIRCYVPAGAERFAPVARAYARLGFARGEGWRRMIAACVTPAIALDGSSSPNPGVAALPRQLLVDHLRSMNPFLSESEVSIRLCRLGWDTASDLHAPPLQCAWRRGLAP